MPRPKKVIEKKSPDPVKAEEKKEGKNETETKKYNGIRIIRIIEENDNSYHIQLEIGTSTFWVPKDEVK